MSRKNATRSRKSNQLSRFVNLLGRRAMRSSGRAKRRRNGWGYEPLEDRKLLSATAFMSGFVLHVDGDNFNNGISVSTTPDNPNIVVSEYQNGSYVPIFSAPKLGVASIVMRGLGGDDTLSVNDHVLAPATIIGGAGNDYLWSGGGTSVIYGHNVNSNLGSGNDTLVGGAGDVTMYGQGGNDLLFAGTGVTHAYGGNGNDVLWADQYGQSYLHGDQGNDTFYAKAGYTAFYGGAGTDTVSYEDWVSDVTIHVNGQYQSGKTNGVKKHLINADLEVFKTGAGNDEFFGNNNANIFYGNDGDDLAYGAGGNDALVGGNGSDTLYGGDGNDGILGGIGDDFLYGERWQRYDLWRSR